MEVKQNDDVGWRELEELSKVVLPIFSRNTNNLNFHVYI